MRNPPPTQAEVKELLDYNPDTGVLVWKITKARKRTGYRAGSISPRGKRVISVLGFSCSEARIIWLWMTGVLPDFVEHIDRDGTNNKWDNLRLATHAENCMNQTRMSSTGFKGVSIAKNNKFKKYRAQINLNGKKYWLGHFYTPEEAHEAYKKASRKLHGEFGNLMIRGLTK